MKALLPYYENRAIIWSNLISAYIFVYLYPEQNVTSNLIDKKDG